MWDDHRNKADHNLIVPRTPNKLRTKHRGLCTCTISGRALLGCNSFKCQLYVVKRPGIWRIKLSYARSLIGANSVPNCPGFSFGAHSKGGNMGSRAHVKFSMRHFGMFSITRVETILGNVYASHKRPQCMHSNKSS